MRRTLEWADHFGREAVAVEGLIVQGDVFPHRHDFAELVLVHAGTGTHQSFAGDRPLRAGALVALRPGAWHQYRDCRDLRLTNIAWRAGDDGLVAALVPPFARWRDGEGARRRGVGVREGLRGNADVLTAGVRDPRQRLPRLADWLWSLAPWPAVPVPDAAARLAERIAAALEADLGRPWTLAALGRELGHHPDHLRRAAPALGGPPLRYLHRLRETEAARLLVTTDLSVGEIALRVGWPDANYLARRFRARFGRTPSSYRQAG